MLNEQEQEHVRSMLEKFKQEANPWLRKVTVPILALQDGKPVLDRSSTFLAIADKHFLLTAAHDLQTYIRANLSFFAGGGPNQRPVSLQGCRFGLGNENGIDVGYVELSQAQAISIKADFEPIRLNNIDWQRSLDPAFYTIIGYPHTEPFFRTTDTTYTPQSICYTSTLYEGKTIADPLTTFRFSPVKHIALSFELMAQEAGTWNPAQLPNARKLGGISGGGIWRLCSLSTQPSEWKLVDCKLVGIQHRLNDVLEYALGTKIGYALGLIEQQFPGMTNSSRLILP